MAMLVDSSHFDQVRATSTTNPLVLHIPHCSNHDHDKFNFDKCLYIPKGSICLCIHQARHDFSQARHFRTFLVQQNVRIHFSKLLFFFLTQMKENSIAFLKTFDSLKCKRLSKTLSSLVIPPLNLKKLVTLSI